MARVLFDNFGDPIPRSLPDLLAEAGSAFDRPISEQRAALEALAAGSTHQLQRVDPHLLRLRLAERADEELPRLVGGLRRDRLIAHDALTTTWHGWCQDDGRQGAVRCPRPAWRRDPVLLRRLERGVNAARGLQGLAPARWVSHDPSPHVRYRLDGIPLASLLPAEDPPDPLLLVRWLGTGLETIAGLHARGLAVKGLTPHQLLLTSERATLLWLDPVEAPADPVADVSALATCLLLLDPDRLHPIVQLMEPWIADAPGSAAEASTLLRRSLADHLVASRHSLAMRSRSTDRGTRTARLYAAAQALQRAVPPPPGRCVLRAGHDRVLYLVDSDGESIRGGAAAGVPPHGLLPLFTPRRGLDAPAARTLLRAWARREDGDGELRLATQARWEGSDEHGAAIVRWLSVASRLRRAQLMLAYRLRR